MRNSPRRSARFKQETDTKIGPVSTDLTGAKGDISATKQDLEATKAKLTSTVGDLGGQSGLIARNYEELQQLKHWVSAIFLKCISPDPRLPLASAPFRSH